MINRRDALAMASLAAGAAAAGSCAGLRRGHGRSAGDGATEGREFYELRIYKDVADEKAQLLRDYLKNAAVPAWNRQGVRPVGVFEPTDAEVKDVVVLLASPCLATVALASSRLLEDAKYREAAEAFLSVPKKEPAYSRIESSLLLAFKECPKVEVPKTRGADRVYELRIYESHNTFKARKKVQMFDEGGEIDIFRKVKLPPVFYGEALTGPNVPNLAYMVSGGNLEEHKAGWKRFGGDPDWKSLRGQAEYKDTVSKIHNVYLRALDFSQI